MTDGSKHRLLIVDDDPLARALLRKPLTTQGYMVDEAENGQDALACAMRELPSVILSDWMMPIMDGLTFCQLVKAEPVLNPCYFILLTAKQDLKDKVLGLDSGVDDYLVKPADTTELEARVRAGIRIVDTMRQFAEVSRTDQLTGLRNRRAFDEMLERERAVADRSGQPFSLIMLDLDRFKALNDTHGHQAGDDALKGIAGFLQHVRRMTDTVFRIGGDEFAIILPRATWTDCIQYAGRLKETFGTTPPRCRLIEALASEIGLSVGVATFDPTTPISNAELLRLADEDLYRDKRNPATGFMPSQAADSAAEESHSAFERYTE